MTFGKLGVCAGLLSGGERTRRLRPVEDLADAGPELGRRERLGQDRDLGLGAAAPD